MKKILLIYPSMILGGSTTSLLALINGLNRLNYQIDLQLQSNSGPLLKDVPDYVNLLPEAQKYTGKTGKIIKVIKFVLQGTMFKAWLTNFKKGEKGFSRDVIIEFQARSLSSKSKKHYDYAIGFLEGWSDVYLAYNVNAEKKYAWMHSTFANITKDPRLQLNWMKKVDNIVFVTEACTEDFKKTLPSVSAKALTIENITDSELIRKRSLQENLEDKDYVNFSSADCFKLITVCRIAINTKGLDRIVECCKKLKENGVEFLWYVLGSGSDEKHFENMIEDAGLKDYLVPVGMRLNPYPYIKQADIMCMPSRFEGKPMVITESMILGVPPVVTQYLSACDQIDNFVDGIVVENSDDSIFEVIMECIRGGKKLENMKENLLGNEYGNPEYIYDIDEKLFR